MQGKKAREIKSLKGRCEQLEESNTYLRSQVAAYGKEAAHVRKVLRWHQKNSKEIIRLMEGYFGRPVTEAEVPKLLSELYADMARLGSVVAKLASGEDTDTEPHGGETMAETAYEPIGPMSEVVGLSGPTIILRF